MALAYLTDERLAEIKTEIAHDLWPPVADIAALVEEVQASRASQEWSHGAMRNRWYVESPDRPVKSRMYLIGEDEVINLDQVSYAIRHQDRITLWLTGVVEEFTFYDQQYTVGEIGALWKAIKDAPPAEEGGRGPWQGAGHGIGAPLAASGGSFPEG